MTQNKFGFIAQELDLVISEVVSKPYDQEDKETFWGVAYGQIVAVVVMPSRSSTKC